jgi:hypothetical protein
LDGKVASQEQNSLESYLPPKNDTDAIISFYLKHLESIYRVVHIPTFQRDYDTFWMPDLPRSPAMTVLILSMVSISSGLISGGDSTSVQTRYRAVPVKWVSACEDWLRKHSLKHSKLVHYQVACLVYLAKRINIIKKKSWWKETGSMIQNALTDGLHCEPPRTADSP